MLNRVDHGQHVLPGRLGAARQVDDQRPPADARRAAGQAAARGNLHAFHAHGLRNAARFAFHHCQRCLGRNIARGKARAARGKHQVYMQFIAAFNQLRLNLILFIGNDRGINHLIPMLRRQLAQNRAALILALALISFVT